MRPIVKHMLQYAPEQLFHALADPTRRDIVETLAREAPCSVSRLAQRYPMTLSAVGQHLRVLEASGLVTSVKQGRTRTCRLSPDAFHQLHSWVADRRSMLEARLDRLEAHLAKGTET